MSVYQEFLNALIVEGYAFQRFQDFIIKPDEKAVVLRHDVDARPENSLEFARIQHRLDIQGTYYFRLVPQSFDPSIIREIAAMGHEIGYHYETMDTADGDPEFALAHFEEGLNRLRSIAEVRTICMHGSPFSRYDNRDLWKWYNYRDYGIIGEPYFDLDFARVLYLTDTGRRWDGDKVSVRDRGNVGGWDQSWDRVPRGALEGVGDRDPMEGLDSDEDMGYSAGDKVSTVDRAPQGALESAGGDGSEANSSRAPEDTLESVQGKGSARDRATQGALESAGGDGSEANSSRAPEDTLESVKGKGSTRDRATQDALESAGGVSYKASEEAGDSGNTKSKGAGSESKGQQPLAAMVRFKSTSDLIQASRNNQLPLQIMINFHPQRWTDDTVLWIREWLMQNMKNVVKRGLIWVRG